MSFKLKTEEDGEMETIDAIACSQFIDKYLPDLTTDQIDSINEELHNHAEQYLCPDYAYFLLEG